MHILFKISLRINKQFDYFFCRHVEEFLSNTSQSHLFKSCDHVFFFHNYRMTNILGLAFVNEICKKKASANLFINTPEIIMAHELGHNLAAQHDGYPTVKKYSLYFKTYNTYKTYST